MSFSGKHLKTFYGTFGRNNEETQLMTTYASNNQMIK